MAYTTVNKSTAHFNTKIYTGTGSSNAITGVGFQPDLVWLKDREATYDHNVFDAVRGATKYIYTNATDAEVTHAERLKSFDSDGFTLGTQAAVNSSNDFVSWNWKANGAGVTNNDGSVTSTVSVNATAGFSIVKYNVGSGGAITVGHGLGSAPELIISKGYSSASNWILGADVLSPTWENYVLLNGSQVEADSTLWEDVAPTSTVFATSSAVYGNNLDNIAYCFKSIPGYSRIGLYKGNNSQNDGVFIYTGFAPSCVMIKNLIVAEHWVIHDNKRPGYNGNGYYLYPNLSNVEATNNTSHTVDLLSNGFKIRSDNDQWNDAANTLYMAWGQTIVGTNDCPATAR